VIERATTDRQRVVAATLDTLPEQAAARALQPPALIVVGEVVRLRPGLDWLAARTRPSFAAS
jgi:uroporphyrin-III C-methyltransferase